MTAEKSQQQSLATFYAQAQEMLEKLAISHGLEVPKGAATIESGCLHWRLSVYAEASLEYWKRQWEDHFQNLDLPLTVKPGDKVIDQDGNEWTLLGLDPTGGEKPVRVSGLRGKDSFLSLALAQLLQRIG